MAKIRVGVIGLGMMGLTHLDVYRSREDVEIAAIADQDADRLSGKVRAAGNIEGQAQEGVDFDSAKRYQEGMDLIADPDVDVVDVCLPTPLHLDYGKAALSAGKHLLMEKPLARTHDDALALVEAAAASDRLSMPGMCMRFWPGWTWLKETVKNKAYGAVRAAHFRRVASHPGGAFYSNGQLCGGAVLDLHIHDTDFIRWLFGTPQAVSSVGYACNTGAIDHITTNYAYDDIPLVTAEGGWSMAPGFPFSMQYTVNFEEATAVFDLAQEKTLVLYKDGQATPIEMPQGMGYTYEIHYFLDCLAAGRKPSTVTFQDAAEAVRLIEAEVESVNRRQEVRL